MLSTIKNILTSNAVIGFCFISLVAIVCLFAIIGVVDGWPRIELMLYGPRAV